MRIAEVIKLLASPFPVQSTFLGEIPENTAMDGFTKFNAVHRMAVLYLDSIQISEGEGGSEGEESWLTRTEIPSDLRDNREHPLWQSMLWLTISMQMLMALDKPFLFTRHGLRTAYEWKLVRHLASDVCRVMEWSPTLRYATFESLWHELGAGVIDDNR